MRLIMLAALIASTGACSPREADDKPPILPRTGNYQQRVHFATMIDAP